jgi:proline dehydrogenase
MNPLRPAILAAAKSPRVKAGVIGNPLTRRIVRRFVAGEGRADALAAADALLASGRAVTLDHLGEDTTDSAQADATLLEYLELVRLLGESREAGGAATGSAAVLEVSVKLSALGQAIPGDGPRRATGNLRELCAAARQFGVLVTVDAEDHTTTEHTLRTVGELRGEFPWLGVVLQAYLHRTEADCKELAGPLSRVRLCKGAYREPKTIAYQSRTEVDESYLRCLEILMAGEGYPMVASHDPAMIHAAHRLAAQCHTEFEHQMLYGIRDSEQQRLAGAGYAMRVYVPYGRQWYGYFMRRLAERPANLAFFLRALSERRR